MSWLFGKKGDDEKSVVESPLAEASDDGASPDPPPQAETSHPRTTPIVFISYRRTSALAVEHIHEKYCGRYRADSIFLDRADIDPGARFPDRLREAINQAEIVLVVIGRDWASVQNERTLSRRLDEEEDWVRQEVVIALSGSATVIPVLVDGAKLPSAEQLPPPLRPLLERNCVTLSMDHFGEDVTRLIGKIGEGLGEERMRDLQRTGGEIYPVAAPVRPIPLSNADIAVVLKQLPQWRLLESDIMDDPRMPSGYRRVEIVRDFQFATFVDAIGFMSRAVDPIELFGHHPRWQNTFRTVTVALSTWDIGHRPSDRDLKVAQMFDRLYKEFTAERGAES